MIDRGIVFKIDGKTAWVEIAGFSQCEGCAACQMFAGGKRGVVAENPIGAEIGDTVEVEISTSAKIISPVLAFGIPVAALIIGMILGNMFSDTLSVVFGLVFLAAGFLSLKLIDRYMAQQSRFRNIIIRKIP